MQMGETNQQTDIGIDHITDKSTNGHFAKWKFHNKSKILNRQLYSTQKTERHIVKETTEQPTIQK